MSKKILVTVVGLVATVLIVWRPAPAPISDSDWRPSPAALPDYETTSPTVILGADSWRQNPPSEAYALRQIQLELAKILYPMWIELTQPPWGQGSKEKACPINPYRWTPEDQTIPFGPEGENICGGVFFSDVRYTPESDLKYGQPRPDESPFQNVPDAARRYDNRGGTDPEMAKLEETFAVEQSVEHSQSSTFTLDVTVGTETSIGGEYAGASFEQSLSTEVHTGLESSKESTESMGTTQEDSVSIDYDVGGGSDVLFVFTNAPVTIRTDYDIDAYYDMNITFYSNNLAQEWHSNTHEGYNAGVSNATWNIWSRYSYYTRCYATDDNPGWRDRKQLGGGGYYEINFESLSDLADMVAGTNVAWPRLADDDCSLATGTQDNEAGYHGIWPGVGTAMDQATEPEVVHIRLTGTRVQTTRSAITVKTFDLSGCPDDVADVVEENAENEDGKHDDLDSIFVVGGVAQDCHVAVEDVTWAYSRKPQGDPTPSPTTTTTGPS